MLQLSAINFWSTTTLSTAPFKNLWKLLKTNGRVDILLWQCCRHSQHPLVSQPDASNPFGVWKFSSSFGHLDQMRPCHEQSQQQTEKQHAIVPANDSRRVSNLNQATRHYFRCIPAYKMLLDRQLESQLRHQRFKLLPGLNDSPWFLFHIVNLSATEWFSVLDWKITWRVRRMGYVITKV